MTPQPPNRLELVDGTTVLFLPMLDLDREAYAFDGYGNYLDGYEVKMEVRVCGDDGPRIVVSCDISQLVRAHIHAFTGPGPQPPLSNETITFTLPISGVEPEERESA